ncbi:flavonoid 7-O-glucosyltransferase [Cinnamomum micranthum f. kanehirae]|uniref:Glycosyltransferase n=1 Tax=Cinnamomum micranthum f. kanehirae TaxID=337451 RepID=A0A443P9D5_9MAGN|nr:flavonoid 7-O-glucosyltransferase [Cinnamomum micranthum f. kanehirae]
MASEMSPRPFHVLFFPMMAQGHLIPMTDIAKLFALRQGVHVSIATTPLNATRIQSTIDRAAYITIHLLQFPCSEASLPDGCESLDLAVSQGMGMAFTEALALLHHPFEQLVEGHRPDCIVSDMLFPWTVEVAAKFNIPRLVFHGTGFFAICAGNSIERYSPHESVATDTEPFLLPKLPHPIEMTRSQVPDFLKTRTPFTELMERVQESINQSYGVVMNSFYELEPDYVKHYREEVRGSIKAWHIGPVSLCNKDQIDMAERGKKAFIDPTQCMDWLGLRDPGTVVYVSFGSLSQMGGAQLMEIALALEASGRPFIWSLRINAEWLPDGFEERTKERGLIIKGWAPQLMILNHPAVGGFVTHCGWNSILEGVTAGVPMVTWPLFAEQFYNEKLITCVVRIGVGVGSQVWSTSVEDESRPVIKREEIVRAVAQLMDGGDEADERRRRARELGETAKKAVEKGGSSYMDLDRLMEELKLYGHQTK